jgi:hypothetical protein
MPRHSSHILELARRGAEHRYAELQAEIAALVNAFPTLGGSRPTGRRRRLMSHGPIAAASDMAALPVGSRKRRHLSAAARAKISAAQKARWAKLKAVDRKK